MWRPHETSEEDVLAGNDPERKRRRSRRRAWRDGLAVQTIIENLEDGKPYRSFERAIVASFGPRSVIELELISRLASLFWRLHRANAIETGLFEIQGEFPLARRQGPSHGPCQPGTPPGPGSNGRDDPPAADQEPLSRSLRPPLGPSSNSRAMAQCFLRLSNLDPTLLARVGAYETRLWRQATQTIWTLDAMRRPPTAPARPQFRKPVARRFWDWDRRIRHSVDS